MANPYIKDASGISQVVGKGYIKDSDGLSRKIKKAYMKQNGVSVECWGSLEIVSWATGTDEQIVAMVEAADRGEIDLADYWSVGDTRMVKLDAMGGLIEAEQHESQYVEFVIMHVGGYKLNNPTESGRTTCSFIVGMKDALKSVGEGNGPMDTDMPTGFFPWGSCDRRTWCNDVFRNAIPNPLRSIFKPFKNTVMGLGRVGFVTLPTLVSTTDYFTFPAVKEIIGDTGATKEGVDTGYSHLAEFNALFQYDWYKTHANREKRQWKDLKPDGGTVSSRVTWWTRSPYYSYSSYPGYFVVHTYDTDDGNKPATGTITRAYFLSPVGCI